MTTRVVVNPTVTQQLRQHPEMKAMLHLVAGKVRSSAYGLAPKRTTYYARNLRAIDNRVWALDPFGHLVEWGSVNNPPYAPLRRGAIAVGLRFVPNPR